MLIDNQMLLIAKYRLAVIFLSAAWDLTFLYFGAQRYKKN